jgi:hypothetical protein
MKTNATSKPRLARAFCTLLRGIVATATLGSFSGTACGQIFVGNAGNGGIGSGTIGEYATSGATVNPALITGLTNPYGVAVSGDKLFFTNINSGTISEYTTAGVPVNGSLITGLSGPWGIAVFGTNLFVVNNGTGIIGKYTTSGATVNASLITGLSGATDIAVSDDGAYLFVANSNINTIGKYTTSGATVNASLIPSLHTPYGIAVSGSNLFVANENNGTIGKYTTSGASVNVALISGLSQPVAIAVSLENLFVVEHFSQRIGKYTTSGATVNASLVAGLPLPQAVAVVPKSILANISTRLRVETGDNVLIAGFIVTGAQPKKVIVRAIGPSLPVVGKLADPTLELRDGNGGLIRVNDNWRTDQEGEIIATGVPPSSDLESAIVATLPANGSAYTAIVRGVNNGTGIGLVEAYDLDQTVDSKLANISTRGLVQTGDNVLIAGTIVRGQAPQRVLVRAIGPSLPVLGKLADPTLELRDGNGTLIRANDNWRTDQEAEIIATGIPPSNNLESAIVATLSATADGTPYTAILRGVNNTTGVALVEFYNLN